MTSRIQLTFRATNLRDRDVFSKTDAFLTLYDVSAAAAGSRLSKIGRTETVNNTLSPCFVHAFEVDFDFQQKQLFAAHLQDDDGQSEEPDWLGSVVFSLAEVLSQPGGTLTLPIDTSPPQDQQKRWRTAPSSTSSSSSPSLNPQQFNKNNKSALTISAVEINTTLDATRDECELFIRGENLRNMDTLSKSDCYFILSRVLPNGACEKLYQSETIDDDLNPLFRPTSRFPISMLAVAARRNSANPASVSSAASAAAATASSSSQHKNSILKIAMFDEDLISSDAMGSVYLTLDDLYTSSEVGPLELEDEAGEKFGDVFVRAQIHHRPSFLDYIQCGAVELQLTIGVDFTMSNLNPSLPNSLHHIESDAFVQSVLLSSSSNSSSGAPVVAITAQAAAHSNPYVAAIVAVADVLLPFCSGGDEIAMFGFGGTPVPPLLSSSSSSAAAVSAKPQHFMSTSLFNMTLDADDPFVKGTAGALNAYAQCVKCVRLSGPTNFAPLVRCVATAAKAMSSSPSASAAGGTTSAVYTLLLIITDGEISDAADTLEALVEASSLPLSLVIVGVGDGDRDFSALIELDADSSRLRGPRSGNVAKRDIVHFVEFQRWASSGAPPEALASEVLREIPRQVVEWAEQNGVRAPLWGNNTSASNNKNSHGAMSSSTSSTFTAPPSPQKKAVVAMSSAAAASALPKVLSATSLAML